MHGLGHVAGPVRDRSPHLECLGRAGIPPLAADQLGPADRHPAPRRRPLDLVFEHQRLEVEVLVLDLPAHRRQAASPLVRLEQQRRRKRVDHDLHVRLDGRHRAMGETLPSIVRVWTANQYSPSCDDRNVNVGWSGNVLLIAPPVVSQILRNQQMQLLDPVLGPRDSG